VDTTALVIRVVVHSADIRDADGAELVFEAVKEISRRLKKIWADMGYRGEKLRQWILANTDWELEIVQNRAAGVGIQKMLNRRRCLPVQY